MFAISRKINIVVESSVLSDPVYPILSRVLPLDEKIIFKYFDMKILPY